MASSVEEGAAMVGSKLDDGSALDVFRRMCIAQGVDKQDADNLCHQTTTGWNNVLPKAQHCTPICAQESGECLVE